MLYLANYVLLFATISLFLLTVFLAFEVISATIAWASGTKASLSEPPNNLSYTERPRIAVVVPARNESKVISATLDDIKTQLRAGDRLLVVADNCTDDTASIAASLGAEVIVREDLINVGKGYALHRAIEQLEKGSAPDVVIIIDADCRLSPGALDHLSVACAQSGRPAQGNFEMHAPVQATVDYRVAEFAWRVKNLVRPLGLALLGLPCQLMGTGMAFPWTALKSVSFASGNIVEDLEYGLAFAAAGIPPAFCQTAKVTSYFPNTATAAVRQRERWEHGHMKMILTQTVPLLRTAIARRSLGLLVLTVDMSVPPLVLMALLINVVLILAAMLAWFGGPWLALAIAVATASLFAIILLLSWLYFGREILPAYALLQLGSFAFQKLGLYFRFMHRRQRASRWTPTDRR